MPEEVVSDEPPSDVQEKKHEFDDVFQHVRSFGTYQRILFHAFNLLSLPMMAQFTALVFVLGTPHFHCADHNSTSCPPNTCCDNCTDYVFDGPIITTVSEWNLICDRAHIGPTLQSCYFVGMLIGSLVTGMISDAWGRKKCVFICTVLLNLAGGGSSFVDNIPLFAFLRVVVGFSLTGMMLSHYVYLMEIVGVRHRTFAGNITYAYWYGGAMLMIFVAYLLPEWRWLQLVYTLPSALLLPFWSILPETPRWLAANGQLDESLKVLMKFGGKGNKPVDTVVLRTVLEEARKEQLKKAREAQKYTPIDMFRTKKIRKLSFIVCLHWFVTALIGFGVFLFMSQLAGNMYVNYAIMRLITTLRVPLTWALYLKFGRRLTFGVSMIGAAALCFIVLGLFKDFPLVTTGIAIVVKAMIDTNWTGVYLMTSELFPTVLRNTATGTGSSSARVGAILAPYIAMAGQLPGLSIALPVSIFGGCAIIAGLVTYWIPETLFAKLHQTIEEAEVAEDDYRLVCCGKPLNRKDLGDAENAVEVHYNPGLEREDKEGTIAGTQGTFHRIEL